MKTNINRNLPLRFGIDSLDELISKSADVANTEYKESWTAAVIGPDGCGKSILGLHLASTYWEDSNKSGPGSPRVIYASTDLSYEQALRQWKNFGLDFPTFRKEAVDAAYDNRSRELAADFTPESSQLQLIKIRPVFEPEGDNTTQFKQLLGDSPKSSQSVYFFDLQADTAGDDWGFIIHLLGLLPNCRECKSNEKHLLIVDAVEGLEAFVGGMDSFGQKRDRRSRVAQIIRVATAIGVHVVFVVEEPQAELRLPEQFVTDLVVRVRQKDDGSYTQRTLEVEKCRAVAHVRGQHELCIRHGNGSSTGTTTNLDDPRILWRSRTGDLWHKADEFPQLTDPSIGPDQCLSHIHIIHSLYSKNRQIREERISLPELIGSPTFALPALDQMLKKNVASRDCLGSITMLVGENGTMKGSLGRRFLAQAFCNESGKLYNEDVSGVAVLLSTRFIDRESLVAKLAQHLNLSSLPEGFDERVYCLRFGTRHLTSGAFVDIVARYIEEAQKKLLFYKDQSRAKFRREKTKADRRKESHRIRFVLEDWNNLLSTYPNLQNETLLLSTILSLFRTEGITALIVSTQPGQPGAIVGNQSHELRNLDENQILTWSVPFYGDRRVAITTNGSASPPIICELRSVKPEMPAISSDDDLLQVSRHFDLYADVDLGKPHRVPLVVRLYLGNHHAEGTTTNCQFPKLLQDTFEQQFPAPAGHKVVTVEPYMEYDRLSTFADVLDDSHLDHTLVFQVDEFWAFRNDKALLNLNDYLNGATVATTEHKRDTYAKWSREPSQIKNVADEDPMGIYTPHKNWFETRFGDVPYGTPVISSREASFQKLEVNSDNDTATQLLKRTNFFVGEDSGGMPQDHSVNRLPYTWDFGILLANRELWHKYRDLKDENGVAIATIWNTLCCANADYLKFHRDVKDQQNPIRWEAFFQACRRIAELENIPAFDIDLSTAESISCLILELWASNQLDADMVRYEKYFRQMQTRGGRDSCHSLQTLVQNCPGALMKAISQVIVNCPQLRARDRIVYRVPEPSSCVASRQWYHTASAIMKHSPTTNFVPLSLPGNHSVRGDWHLAAAAGSRSEILAHRTFDSLSSRRNNLLRMQDGLGLPVRDILPDVCIGDLPTAMACIDDSCKQMKTLTYRDICSLGVEGKKSQFTWIWRSSINHYERDNFYWKRWLARMIEEHDRWLPSALRSNKVSFDLMFARDFPSKYETWVINDDRGPISTSIRRFDELRKTLQSALRGDVDAPC